MNDVYLRSTSIPSNNDVYLYNPTTPDSPAIGTQIFRTLLGVG